MDTKTTLHSDLPGTLTHYNPLTCAHCIWPYEEHLKKEAVENDVTSIYKLDILEQIRDLEAGSLSAAPKKLYTELVEAGWEVHLSSSKTTQKQAPFASGQKEGQPRPDKNVTWVWISAGKGVAKFTATYENGRYKDAVCSDPVLGRFVAKAKMELDEWRLIF